MFAERVFEELYGTKELHVSKDGWTFQRPTDQELGRTPNDHFDQGNRWMGLQCIQGSVALTDQTEDGGCFKVWPSSHKYREEILSHPKHSKTAARADFIIVRDDDKELLRERCIKPCRVAVKRGDVVLWRSDVCHCGAPPLGACDAYRTVVYVCCLPAVLTPDAVYVQKRRAYERLETGCHYPSREEWFEAVDRHKKLPWRPYFTAPPKLTHRQQQLCGLVRYGGPTSTCEELQCSEKSKAEDVGEAAGGGPGVAAAEVAAVPPASAEWPTLATAAGGSDAGAKPRGRWRKR